jgi:hypothetical protein
MVQMFRSELPSPAKRWSTGQSVNAGEGHCRVRSEPRNHPGLATYTRSADCNRREAWTFLSVASIGAVRIGATRKACVNSPDFETGSPYRQEMPDGGRH